MQVRLTFSSFFSSLNKLELYQFVDPLYNTGFKARARKGTKDLKEDFIHWTKKKLSHSLFWLFVLLYSSDSNTYQAQYSISSEDAHNMSSRPMNPSQIVGGFFLVWCHNPLRHSSGMKGELTGHILLYGILFRHLTILMRLQILLLSILISANIIGVIQP